MGQDETLTGGLASFLSSVRFGHPKEDLRYRGPPLIGFQVVTILSRPPGQLLFLRTRVGSGVLNLGGPSPDVPTYNLLLMSTDNSGPFNPFVKVLYSPIRDPQTLGSFKMYLDSR